MVFFTPWESVDRTDLEVACVAYPYWKENHKCIEELIEDEERGAEL